MCAESSVERGSVHVFRPFAHEAERLAIPPLRKGWGLAQVSAAPGTRSSLPRPRATLYKIAHPHDR